MFWGSLAHARGVKLQQLLDQAIVSNIWHCGEIISVLFTEVNMYTIIGAACSVECVHGTMNMYWQMLKGKCL
jgi:hypothetical protein